MRTSSTKSQFKQKIQTKDVFLKNVKFLTIMCCLTYNTTTFYEPDSHSWQRNLPNY